MHSFENGRTGLPVLDRLGDNFDQVLARIDQQDAAAQAQVLTLPASPRHRARLATAFAAAAAVIGIAVALAYGLIAGNGSPLTTEQALADIAQTASVQTLPPDDAYVFTRARTIEAQFTAPRPNATGKQTATPIPFFVTSERQSWLSIANSGLIETRRTGVSFVDDADEQRVAAELNLGSAESSFRYPAIGAYRIGDREYTRAQIERYPTDPQQIVDHLNREIKTTNESDRTLALWDAVTAPLSATSPPLPQALRAGLVESIALVPGAETVGTVETPSGEQAAGFALTTQGLRRTIAFDKETSAVLFDQTKVITQAAAQAPAQSMAWPPGTIIKQYELLDQTQTTSLPPATK